MPLLRSLETRPGAARGDCLLMSGQQETWTREMFLHYCVLMPGQQKTWTRESFCLIVSSCQVSKTHGLGKTFALLCPHARSATKMDKGSAFSFGKTTKAHLFCAFGQNSHLKTTPRLDLCADKRNVAFKSALNLSAIFLSKGHKLGHML